MKSESILRQMKMETQHSKIYGMQQNSKREIYSDSGLPQETRKISNKQCNFTPQLNLKQKNEKSFWI